MLGTARVKSVLEALPGKVPGTRQQPLTQEAEAAVAKIADADLDRFIWEAEALQPAQGAAAKDLADDLARQVRELLSQDWRPLLFPAGKHPTEAYRFFVEPTETLYTLARAYPLLDPDLQGQVKAYVAKQMAPGGPLAVRTGERVTRGDEGEVRALYDVPAGARMKVQDDLTRCEVARLYPLWLWARATGDWGPLERRWKDLKEIAGQAPNKMEEDCRNGYVAGLIAGVRIARHLKDDAAIEAAMPRLRRAMLDRIAYELAYPNGGVVSEVPTGRSIFSRWRHLTPEVGRLCAAYAGPIQRHLVDVYVDYHRPTWWLAWNVELLWRNESPLAMPTMSAEVFDARAMILGEPAEKLARFRDLPWCKADLFYIQKTVLCLEACGKTTWQDVRK
jgi:hypothetical protein